VARRNSEYGFRPDGQPRDPWHNRADAQALGYSSPYAFRKARAEERGYSIAQGRGHARFGEVPISRELRQWAQLPGAPTTTGWRQASRMARLSSDVGRLLNGRLTPRQFDGKWGGKQIGVYEAPSAAEVQATARVEGPPHGRPYRRVFARAA
jgi:hypothetical protein